MAANVQNEILKIQSQLILIDGIASITWNFVILNSSTINHHDLNHQTIQIYPYWHWRLALYSTDRHAIYK